MSLPQSLPRVLTTEEIVPAMQRIINEYDTIRALILEAITPTTATFRNVMLPLVQVENSVQGELGMIYMLQYGSPSLATQSAFDEARTLYLRASALWTADEKFFKLLQAAKEKPDFQTLDGESKHLLEKELLEYKHAGLGILGHAELEEYQKSQMEISDLERKFQQNLAREAGGVVLFAGGVEWGEEELISENHQQIKKFVPFANGGTLAVLTHAHSPETRKKMFLADNSKLKENKPLFEEIIKRRARQAQFLKYTTHAEFRIERRMAKATSWVKGFLSQLQTTLCLYGRLITEGRWGSPVWEKRYYEQLVQREFQIDQLKISEFFPLERTATNMLAIFASLLGLRFDSIPAERLTEDFIWHDTVRGFSVWDTKDDCFVGYLYFDLLWRENKYRGNQSVNIQWLSTAGWKQAIPFNNPDVFLPDSNSNKLCLTQTSPSKMGHGIHDLLARTKYIRFHGYRLPPDFGEMPSIMLENWCWMKDVLEELSCHYTTLDENYLADWQKQHPSEPNPPTKIPEGLVENLIKHRYFNRGLYHLYQLSISIFDLQIHSLSTDKEIADLDVQNMWYDLREEIEGMDFSECRDGFAFGTFTHLTAGYDVCYYAYLCCTAMAQDLFLSVFAHDPHNRETWDKYRRGILEYGGREQNLLGMLEGFLERPPNMNSLVEVTWATTRGAYYILNGQPKTFYKQDASSTEKGIVAYRKGRMDS
ncbi:Peptidase M3A/M3B [Penicillium verrucosum]|uniref:Peptidase M3A/M3B n=1 Tax=Penicillium verrucosum TaxID=60171 RepID=UPI0025455FD1|nr:Peptidase M3A/M3B [Penicillium verrucosum]KAJ5943769.1 Peptidase M3A/M3B [Penicillium verrucosum]